jgi:hypothetical protein
MQAISIIADHLDNLIGIQLARLFQPRLVGRKELAAAHSTRYAYVDIDLADRSDFTDLARWVHRLPKERIVVLAVDRGVRLQATQACARRNRSRHAPRRSWKKPGPLDQAEMATMRQHPELGFAALQSADGLRADILDPLLHHHEYLDGSGYPHGVGGSDLSDLVRVMTISDIYGALLERRSYKEPLSGAAAYGVLQKMGPSSMWSHQRVCTDCTDARLTPPRENGASV